MLTPTQLIAMREVDVRTVDPSTLKDIRDVKINTSLPSKERIQDYIRQIGNPYCYRYGKFVVKLRYADEGATLNDRLESYLRTLV